MLRCWLPGGEEGAGWQTKKTKQKQKHIKHIIWGAKNAMFLFVLTALSTFTQAHEAAVVEPRAVEPEQTESSSESRSYLINLGAKCVKVMYNEIFAYYI